MSEPLVKIPSADGAGQALRTAVAVSAATGRGFVIEEILAEQEHPGIHSQNLTVVQAVAAVCGARVEGNDLHSSRLTFDPGPVIPGEYTFNIGTAGSTVLLMQSLYLPLVLAGAPSFLTLHGGTHVPFSPPYPYLEDAWLPALEAFGIHVELELVKAGFFPRGGGTLHLRIHGDGIQGVLCLAEVGELEGVNIRSITGNLPFHVGERQLDQAIRRLKDHYIAAVGGTETLISEAPGTVLQLIGMFTSGHRIVCSALGKKGQSAEEVADLACEDFMEFLASRGNVDPYAADQLLLPLALAPEEGEYRAPKLTEDFKANAEVINSFLPGRIEYEEQEDGSVRVRNRIGETS